MRELRCKRRLKAAKLGRASLPLLTRGGHLDVLIPTEPLLIANQRALSAVLSTPHIHYLQSRGWD